jgi:hypothetical protein
MGITRQDIPQTVEAAILNFHGEQHGEVWLTNALNLINKLQKDWDFEFIQVLSGEDSLLVKVFDCMEDEKALLKVPFDVQVGNDEVAALRTWRNRSVPFVKKSDSATGAFMMEYVQPSKKKATPFQAFVLADVIQTPAEKCSYEFPSLMERVDEKVEEACRRRTVQERSNIPDFDLAVKTLEILLDTQKNEELLHGDFRNRNIIPSEYGLVIVNPRPCIGDSLYDIAVWLVDSGEYENVTVIHRLLDIGGARLIPWVWSLSVIDQRASEVSDFSSLLKAHMFQWWEKHSLSHAY